MELFDTLKKEKVVFEPCREGEVGIYLCGPTVYDYGHLGHGRSAIVFDLLRRYLQYLGYRVKFVRNWTDIDDKTIERAQREGVTVQELTERFIEIYREDYDRLNILAPDFAPKPTDHIDDMIAFIERLLARGHAYVLGDGVYFDIASFEGYGALSGQSLDELRSGARIEVDVAKRNPGDFALWKLQKPGEPSWNSPWGRGRPGWHIECSVMSYRYLGEEFDIHCGGQDLIFPHHEDEIAQSRGAGYGFARYWMHNGFLNIDDEKMSKSLGNFFTLRDIFKLHASLAVRFFLLSVHYRAPLNFSEENLEHAENTLRRYNDFIQRVQEIAERSGGDEADPAWGQAPVVPSPAVRAAIGRAREGFEGGLDDDLNISRALAAVADFVKTVNSGIDDGRISPADAREVLAFMNRVDSVLGVFTFERGLLPEEIEELIQERVRAREERDYKRADEIRDLLLSRGVGLEDTREGTRWKRM
jgi:cysteinyl-tRNA synthetase